MSTLQVITLILSIYVLVALVIQSLCRLPQATEVMLDRIDFYVCLVFLADFFTRLAKAPSKLKFFKWGWIDLVSSIPTLDFFRVGRIVRIVRVFRILRAFRSAKNLITYLVRQRKLTSLAAVATSSFVLIVFCSIAVLQLENEPDANIHSIGDAFWWAFVTITTVGYGDKYPVSVEGRILGGVLMTAGVGLFGIFTGFIASFFVEPETERKETERQQLILELQALRMKVEALDSKIDRLSSV